MVWGAIRVILHLSRVTDKLHDYRGRFMVYYMIARVLNRGEYRME